jgi:hypothetical protein
MACYFHDKLVQCSGASSLSLVEKEHDTWNEYDHRNHRSEMSKSVFYASKESLRQTRERELEELLELREFVKYVYENGFDSVAEIDDALIKLMNIHGKARVLTKRYDLRD